MSKTNKIIIGIIAVVIVIGGIWYGMGRKPMEKETIKIGFIGPLTGDVASHGESEKNAVQMAIEEINSGGGINGKLIEVIYEDGRCSGKEAVSGATKLVNIDKVKIILGGACSGETLAVAPITEQNKVILFSAFSSSPDITNIGEFIFRNAPSDKEGGRYVAEMVFDDGYKKIAILTENTDYAQALSRVLKERFAELDGEIVADEVYNPGSRDFRAQLVKIKTSNPEAIFFNPQVPAAGGLAAKQAKELGINVPYYGGWVIGSKEGLESGGSALNGLKYIDAPGLSKKNQKAVIFLEKYLAKYPGPPSDYEIRARYDSVFIIKRAIEYCGKIETECIRDYLYNLSEYDGVIGKYRFDKNGDVVGIKFAIKKIIDAEKGEIIEIE